MSLITNQTLNLNVTHQSDVPPVPVDPAGSPDTGFFTGMINNFADGDAVFPTVALFSVVAILIIASGFFFYFRRKAHKVKHVNLCRLASVACFTVAFGLAIPSIASLSYADNTNNNGTNDTTETITTDFPAIATADGNVSVTTVNLKLDQDYTSGYKVTAYITNAATTQTNTLYGTNHPESQIVATAPAATAADMTMNSYGIKLQDNTYAPVAADTAPTLVYTTDQAATAGTTVPITYATRLNKTTAEDTYTGKITITIMPNMPPTDLTFDQAFSYYNKVKDPTTNLYKMQDMTTEICTAVKAPTASTSGDEQTTTLVDTRDGKTYTVGKLMDGNCWMTQNLALGSTTDSISLSPSDTDLAAGISSFTLPASTSIWDGEINLPEIYYDIENIGTGTDEVFYNYNAATAGAADSTVTPGEVTSSICPKGWKLPTGNTTGQFKALYDAYGSNYANMNAAFKFAFAGFFHAEDSQVYSQGLGGDWWSSTVGSDTHSYGLSALSNGVVDPSGSSNRTSGVSVRCVSR